MLIEFKLFGNHYQICIGYETVLFKQMHFFSLIQLWYDEKDEVCSGKQLCLLFKHPKYKN